MILQCRVRGFLNVIGNRFKNLLTVEKAHATSLGQIRLVIVLLMHHPNAISALINTKGNARRNTLAKGGSFRVETQHSHGIRYNRWKLVSHMLLDTIKDTICAGQLQLTFDELLIETIYLHHLSNRFLIICQIHFSFSNA